MRSRPMLSLKNHNMAVTSHCFKSEDPTTEAILYFFVSPLS